MPMYDYKCLCTYSKVVFKPLAELNRPEVCDRCQGYMTRQVSAPMVVNDYPPYDCPITGKIISGRKAHIENLKRHGCRILEPGETEGMKRRRASDEAAFDATIEATAEELVHSLPTEKREQLISEVVNQGLDTTITRSSV